MHQHARQHHRKQGREHQQPVHETEPAGKAARPVLDQPDHGRAHEATQVADRVDRCNAGRWRR